MSNYTAFEVTPEIEAEFRKRVVVGGHDECWTLSFFGRTSKGYQQMRLADRYIGAHIIACTLAKGPRKAGEIVLHSCNRPQCCNPAHLRWGTYAENVADTVTAGRGDKTPIEQRFSEAELREMKQLLVNGMHVADVAHMYEIGVNSVLKIKHGKIAGHINVEPNDTRLLSKNGKRKRPGRIVFGRRFTAIDIRRIKVMRGAGIARKEVARLWETTPAYIEAIDRGKVWTHVIGPGPDDSFKPAKAAREPKPPREIDRGQLTAGTVWDIKRDLTAGLSPYVVARKYRRADSTVKDIALGKSWAHIDPDALRPADWPRHEPKPVDIKRGPVTAEDNHDASPGAAPSSAGKPPNWWFQKWVDPMGEYTEFSGVDPRKRPYPITGSWERYTFKVGNVRFLMMSDRNDLPYPVGRQEFGGGSPAGAVTGDTFDWWKRHVEAGKDEVIITCHHHMLRETTVASGDYEGVSQYPDGTYRHGRYHGVDGVPEGASYLYFVDDEPKAQKFETYLAANPGAIDLWLGGHSHTHPDDRKGNRSHVERKWGVNFVNVAQLSKFHSFISLPPMSRHFTFTAGSRLVRVRCYLHDDSHAAQGWYAPAERVIELGKPFSPAP